MPRISDVSNVVEATTLKRRFLTGYVTVSKTPSPKKPNAPNSLTEQLMIE